MLNEAKPPARAWLVLAMNTLAFTFCFACWTMNGVLVTHLISTGIFDWSKTQMAVLLATPILTGSLLRLPVGLLTDRYGGRPVYFVLMLVASAFLALNYFATDYAMFVACALGFGLSGASFAVGIAYTSVCFPKNLQGTALGIFGAGNAGAAVTTLLAPAVLKALTRGGANPEGWRMLPVIYAACLAGMAVVFWLLTTNRIAEGGRTKTLARQLAPLRDIRVWRFGYYYFLVFGGFVALSQWLVPYYVKGYGLSLAVAGLYASIFSLPSGVIRAACGWISDQIGARASLYWTFALCALFSFLLIFPEMLVRTPGEGIIARRPGVVEKVDGETMLVRAPGGGADTYTLKNTVTGVDAEALRRQFLPLPVLSSQMAWHGVVAEGGATRPFQPGDKIGGKQLLARGTTTVFFQANVHIFTLFVLLLGLAMGLGKAAVYKHIPSYFPNDVGTVGGLVGVIGGLGGFFCPIIFGVLLDWTGVWTTCWVFLFLLSVTCLVWMHFVVRTLLKTEAPSLLYRVEHPERGGAAPPVPDVG
jgi:NNP family nitrate/nitrite transporter-like MFS transporter